MLEIACPGCGKSYQLPESLRGKGARCKDCKTLFPIPSLKMAAAPPKARVIPPSSRAEQPRALKPGQRLDQLQKVLESIDEFSRPKPSIMYRLVALLVAAVMVTLPLLYVAFTALIAYLTFWHILNDYVWFTEYMRGRAMIFAFFFYAVLGVGGILWTLSLIKPFFLFWGGSEKPEGLSRNAEPSLYTFAHLLADKVGAPRPDVIQISPDVNASASFGTTLLGLRRSDFTLTLGVPLVAGLTLPQLAGVIAHEYGHFSQAGSTLLQRLIRRINLWFMAAIYRRDMLDNVIDSTIDSTHEVGIYPAMAGFFFWLLVGMGKMVLWCLMQIGNVVSAALMRRMEFDADRYEISLVGSEVFEQTSNRLVALNVAYETAFKHVFGGMRGDHLPSDFPSFVVGIADQSQKLQKRAKNRIKNEKWKALATHPPTRDRIKVARKLDEPGVFRSDLPASTLFSNFRGLCTSMSNAMYELRYHSTFSRETLRDTREAVSIYLETMGHKTKDEE